MKQIEWRLHLVSLWMFDAIEAACISLCGSSFFSKWFFKIFHKTDTGDQISMLIMGILFFCLLRSCVHNFYPHFLNFAQLLSVFGRCFTSFFFFSVVFSSTSCSYASIFLVVYFECMRCDPLFATEIIRLHFGIKQFFLFLFFYPNPIWMNFMNS